MPSKPTVAADALEIARRKQAQGRGLKNSEIALLRHAEKVDAQIVDRPRSAPPAPLSEGDTRTTLNAGKDTLASAKPGGPDLTARIAVLEALLSGLTRQTVTYCSGGSSSSKTILMS